ncbi:Dabb family protein [Agreia sp. PsM10]|uniref:Dabb family protein n=1 Tax=Agreia sp. PsM10 TaxID=3030533 RepID=UPI00263BD476|nr:Dabb family protein [Agreia sp. PsM10]MDN4641972.1 Dabb family protein [Agreia sp. PsM10]
MTANFRHVVIFRFYPVVDDDTRAEVVQRLRSFSSYPGVLEWGVEGSLDTRKGQVLFQTGLFDSRESFEAYTASPEHTEVAHVMSSVADWYVADYFE